ncbi:MAG: ATP synthase F1 subunit gamma [Candidatus Limnocylindrales bacterium]
MPSQREIRRRIGSVKNIKQITRAMQFVAASKLKRAQDATLQTRPYTEALDEVLADLAAVLGAEEHPLLARREGGTRALVVITTDRGLAGSLNTNLIRFAARQITEHQGDLTVITVGRKGTGAMRRSRVPIEATFEGFGDRPAFSEVTALSRLLTDDYLSGKLNQIDIVFPRFISTLAQRPEIRRLLPVPPTETAEVAGHIPGSQFIFEPDAGEVLRQLLPRYVATRVYQAVLEATASEQSARMVAMKNATENAQELIEDLTLSYNKVRQANITREMIEIATGANAS